MLWCRWPDSICIFAFGENGRWPDSICIFAFGENYCVAAVQPAASKAPPEPCIYIGSSPFPSDNMKPATPNGVAGFMVPVTGLEPVRILLRGILSPLCLPISPYRHSVPMVSHFVKTVKHYNWSRFNKNAGRHSAMNQFSSAHSMAFMESMVCLAADSNSVLPAFCSSMHLM